jgi:hypothetical protein
MPDGDEVSGKDNGKSADTLRYGSDLQGVWMPGSTLSQERFDAARGSFSLASGKRHGYLDIL